MLKDIACVLKNGGVGVIATDTLYGLVACAFNQKAVARVNKLKKRSKQKPFIILLSDLKDVKLFGVELNNSLIENLKKFWLGQVSVVLPCPSLSNALSYLKPLNKTLAFRCPKDKKLKKLLRQTGPLIAPSANPEGKKPAENIKQAKKYFQDKVDFYADEGTLKGKPSTLLAIKGKQIIVLRQGAIII